MARIRGTPNKQGATARENIVAVFVRLGGTAAMADWARDNRTEFYKLYAKLVPTQLEATVDLRDASAISDAELINIATAGRTRIAGPEIESVEFQDIHTLP
jgi:hypothetical protein